MKQFRKTLCMLLALSLLLGGLPAGVIRASAAEPELGLQPLDGEYQPMNISQNMVEMIKVMEGFSPEPYWDYAQWSIGYGTACGSDPDSKPDITMTEPEAEAELVKILNQKYGSSVNRYCKNLGKQPSQQQFDALVDFTYNLGSSWMDGCRLSRWLEHPTTALELVDAMGAWCRAGGEILYQLAARRVREALIFLHGEYYLMQEPVDFDSELPVVSNSELPRYKFVQFLGNGGKFGRSDDEIQYYEANAPMAGFPTPVLDGQELSGWQVIAESNQNLETPRAIAPGDRIGEQNLEVEALWGENAPTPTEPAPTDPESTDPAPTEPAVYTLTFEPNGGSAVEPVTAKEGETVDLTACVSRRQGFEFNGWYEDTDLTTRVEQVTMTGDRTVYAGWTQQAEPEQMENPFRDVPENAYYRNAVVWAVENGITSGVGEQQFGPNQTCTRAQAVTFLWRAAGSPAPKQPDPGFRDVPENAYYRDAVAWAVENGITAGATDTEFGSEQKCRRGQIITFLWRMAGSPEPESLESPFTDVRPENYFGRAVLWAVENGITSGVSATEFAPQKVCTRAQTVTFLYQYAGK